MLPCHSLYIYGTWRSKYTESLKSMRKLKRGSGSQNVKGAIYIYIYIYIFQITIYILQIKFHSMWEWENWECDLQISAKKKFEGDLETKVCGKRLYPIESVQYLGVKTDRNLNWKYLVIGLSMKLNRANALLFKMRKYVSLK